MFNTDITVQTNNNQQTVNLNEQSTGQLTKLSKTSKLARFEKGSKMENQFFCNEPYIKKHRTEYRGDDSWGMPKYYETDDYYNIDILQVIIFGNDQYLVEYEIGDKR